MSHIKISHIGSNQIKMGWLQSKDPKVYMIGCPPSVNTLIIGADQSKTMNKRGACYRLNWLDDIHHIHLDPGKCLEGKKNNDKLIQGITCDVKVIIIFAKVSHFTGNACYHLFLYCIASLWQFSSTSVYRYYIGSINFVF